MSARAAQEPQLQRRQQQHHSAQNTPQTPRIAQCIYHMYILNLSMSNNAIDITQNTRCITHFSVIRNLSHSGSSTGSSRRRQDYAFTNNAKNVSYLGRTAVELSGIFVYLYTFPVDQSGGEPSTIRSDGALHSR